MVGKPGIVDVRIVLLAGAAVLLVSGCTVAVDRQERERNVRVQTPAGVPTVDQPESPPIDLPLYPGAKAVMEPFPPGRADVSFTGRFADTTTDSSHYATTDRVNRVLQFYRDAMRNYGVLFECRGTINVRPRNNTDELRCSHGDASDSVRLGVSGPGHHAVVSIAPAVSGSNFTLVTVRTRH